MRTWTIGIMGALALAGTLAASAQPAAAPEPVRRAFEDSRGEAFATGSQWQAVLKDAQGATLAEVKIDLESGEIESVIDGKREKGRLESVDKADLEKTLEALHAAWQASALGKTFPMKESCGQCRGEVGCCVNCCPNYRCILLCLWQTLPSPAPGE